MTQRFVFFLTFGLLLVGAGGDFAPAAFSEPRETKNAFYVSPHGNDSWSGRMATANDQGTDGPYATLHQAQKAVRSVLQSGEAGGGITVYLRGGDYELKKAVKFNAYDSGSENHPVVYTNYENETVRLLGGTRIDHFERVRDAKVVQRLDEKAREQVRRVFLKEQGIEEYGQLKARGFGQPMKPAGLELFFNDRPMPLARWPKEGWSKIAAVPEGKASGQFQYTGDHPDRWEGLEDVWLHGFWTHEWADSYTQVKKIDSASNTLFTRAPHGVYGYTKGKRFYALNILEELDSPGEWYLDRQQGILYFWPPQELSEHAAYVSLLNTPLLQFENASHIVFENIGMLYGRSHGVEIKGGSNIRLLGCTLANLGNAGAVVNGGESHVVQDCDVYSNGDGGLQVAGGNRQTLEPANHLIQNNHIHHFNRWDLTYRPAIRLSGVGIRVAHNLMHDGPHNAVMFGGNEHIIEFNEIYNVCYESGDVGAMYTGRDWTTRGTIIRFNYFHDLKGPYSHGAKSVYLDDAASGATIYGNVFFRSHEGAFIGGGRDNTVANNLFIACEPAVHVDARGTSWASEYIQKGGGWRMYEKLEAVPYNKPPYSERYPQLADLLKNKPHWPMGNVIRSNICFGGKWKRLQDDLDETDLIEFKNNLVHEDTPFDTVQAALEYMEEISETLEAKNIQAIPFDKMGLQTSSHRPRVVGK